MMSEVEPEHEPEGYCLMVLQDDEWIVAPIGASQYVFAKEKDAEMYLGAAFHDVESKIVPFKDLREHTDKGT